MRFANRLFCSLEVIQWFDSLILALCGIKMIHDTTVLKEICESWGGVIILREKYKAAIGGSISTGGLFAIFAADAVQNLPFIHACSVLNEALLQIAKEGGFKCKSIFLGKLVDDSKSVLPWINYSLVREIVEKRNDIAHRGKVIPRADCWKYIEAIETEFRAWTII